MEYTVALAFTDDGERQVLSEMAADGWILCAVCWAGAGARRLYFRREGVA